MFASVVIGSSACCSFGLRKLLQLLEYRKIPIISSGYIFVQKALLLGLFSGELNFGGLLIIGGSFGFQIELGLTIKTA